VRKIGVLREQNDIEVFLIGDSVETRKLDLTEIPEENLDALLVSPNALEGEVLTSLEEEKKYYPIYSAEDYSISTESASTNLEKINTRWTLEHNYSSLENLFGIRDLLSNLYSTDRYQFVEELWFFIKTNFKTSEMSIIFHDVETDENQKSKLIYSKAHGGRTPKVEAASKSEADLLNLYKTKMNGGVSIFEEEDETMVLGVEVAESPFLILAKSQKENGIKFQFTKKSN
jgi:hypothetical protein